jgi:hypothetical protein
MKRTVLFLSLAANVVLIFGILMILAGRHHSDSGVASVPAPMAPVPIHSGTSTSGVQVHSGATNMAQLIDQMREAKVPEPLLARMVSADFEERWSQRQREMQEKFNRGDIDEVAMEEFNEQHDSEQENEMRATLGDAAFRKWDEDNVLREFDANKAKLSDTERDAMYDLKKKLARQQHDLTMRMQSGEIDAMECSQQQSAAQTEYDDAVKALLGQQRFIALQNGDDGQAANLRRGLRAMNASDEQFQTLLDAQKKWNEQRAALDQEAQQGQDYASRLQAIDAARDQEYQNVLGTNGYAELQMQQDDRFQTMKHFSSAWQLSDSDISYLYHTLQYYEKTVQEYQRQAQALQKDGQPVDWKGVQNNLRQFAEQTMSGMQNYLGGDRFDRMKNNGILNLAQSDEMASGRGNDQ